MGSFLKELFQRVPDWDAPEVTRFSDDNENDPDYDKNHKHATFDCSTFLDFVTSYKKQLKGEHEPNKELFRVPECLEDVVHVFLFYERRKKNDMHFKNVPPTIRYVDMSENPDLEIASIHRLVNETTNGFFRKLDDATEKQLRTKDFRYLLLGIFHLEAEWNGHSVGEHRFWNYNGEKTNAMYFKLERKRAKFQNNRIHVQVYYDSNGSFIEFSKPCWHWNKKCKYADIHLPRLYLEGREETEPDDHSGKIVINFKYSQHEHGFEAGCLVAEDGVDGTIDDCTDVWFDEPFRIKIYHRGVKVFRVNVYNL